MKQKSIGTKLYLILIALALLFLLGINATYAYFYAEKEVSGSSTMGKLTMMWQIGVDPVASGGVIYLVPSDGDNSISRGETCGISATSAGAAATVSLYSDEGSTSAYVRFWVDAYDVDDTLKTKNYGEHFELNVTDNVASASKTDGSGQRNTIYYVIDATSDASTGPKIRSVIESVTLAEDAPLEMLEKGLILTLHFEAVQTANDAYKHVFGTVDGSGNFTPDWKGILEDWEYGE